MAFNRYETLTKYYLKHIEHEWNWKGIVQDAKQNCYFDEENNLIAASWLGTTLGIMPSGKIYAFWTSNQTRSDMVRDECFTNALEQIADKHGMFVDYDNDSVSVCRVVELDEVNSSYRFNTSEDYDKYLELQGDTENECL